MYDYMVWIWLIVFVLALILEFATADFLTIWFAISALPTAIIAYFFPEMIILQIAFFFLFGFLLMLIIRRYVVKYVKRNVVSTNVDSYIGKTAVVVETIKPNERGLVKFQGDLWTAISTETIEINEKVRILTIEGNKFIVTKKLDE